MEPPFAYPFIFFLSSLLVFTRGAHSIGVNYGTIANNLPPPAQVAQFLKQNTIIDSVKIYDMNPEVIRAFAGTGISVTVTFPNGDIPRLTNLDFARSYLVQNIKPFVPATKIAYILIGNEILHWGDQSMISNLLPAMKSVHKALQLENLGNIKVTTAHSLGILEQSDPPSTARFRPGWDRDILTPMLQFHRESGSPFMVNPYPYFSWGPKNNDFTLFRRNPGVLDKFTGKTYFNMYDFLLDSVYSAMKKVGCADVPIVVGEVGWPSLGDPGMVQTTVENARWHNLNVLKKANTHEGTPLMPGVALQTFIFALFNENLKPGSAAERNFGLFRPDFTPVYDIGIMTKGGGPAQPLPHPGGAHPRQPGKPHPGGEPHHPGGGAHPRPGGAHPQQPGKPHPGGAHPHPHPHPHPGRQWCVPKREVSNTNLQMNLDWLCGPSGGVDCKPVQSGGPCFEPNTVRSHAAYAMNAYFQNKGHEPFHCNFAGTGLITTADPSYGTCIYK